jgi:hypothetical protein
VAELTLNFTDSSNNLFFLAVASRLLLYLQCSFQCGLYKL